MGAHQDEQRESDVAAWAASGAMALSGRPGAPPLGPPSRLVPGLRSLAQRLARLTAATGRTVTADPLQLLVERAAVLGLRRGGTTSCGGAARLVLAADGWVAVSLAREDDVAVVPAWLERDLEGLGSDVGADVWSVVATAAACRPSAELVERGRLLGLPVASLPGHPPAEVASGGPLAGLPVRAQRLGEARPRLLADTLVVDLSSLWAGPLATQLLAAAGARVVKVESQRRPDGARAGPADFYDLLHHDTRSVAVDLADAGGVCLLRRLLARADVVVEASRPRALEQLGVAAADLVAGDAGPQVWVSVTGYGREGPARDRAAFGDDAAMGGGLVVSDDEGPCFCADAVADPVTGLVAAVATLEALAAGGRWLVDCPMAMAAAHLAGPTLAVPPGLVAADPAPPVAAAAPAPALGSDTDAVLHELGLAR